MTMRRILVATDGSENAIRAVEAAARLSKYLGAELLIATVGAGRLSPSEIAEAGRDGMSEGEALEMISREVLADAEKRARREGASEVRVLECVGDPSRIVLDLARSEHVDIIVVGRRGRGRLAGLVFGSVSQKLVSLAPC